MNGAESLVRTLVAGGVEVCFTNPGTSEMHFVAALDRVDGMRCVLCLFEGGATGAADGYARMADKPASTLLHLGPGLANGLANLHNAKKARTPMVNIVGEHATYHREYNAPLTSDIEGLARPMSDWVRTGLSSAEIGADGAAAIAEARTAPGRIATLILPANTAWDPGTGIAPVPPVPERARASEAAVAAAAAALASGEPVLLHLGDRAVRDEGRVLADRIARKTGAKLLAMTSNARIDRGAGHRADRAPALPDRPGDRRAQGLPPHHPDRRDPARRVLRLSGQAEPPGAGGLRDDHSGGPGRGSDRGADPARRRGRGAPRRAAAHRAAPAAADLRSPRSGPYRPGARGADPGGRGDLRRIDHHGRNFFALTQDAAPHSWLQLSGGSIGLGIPMATGAAVACPDAKVINLQADGSGLYTVQALWTQARERLDVVTLIWSNRSYAILRHELTNVGAANPGPKAIGMLSLDDPAVDWGQSRRWLRRRGAAGRDAARLHRRVPARAGAPGPHLIEVAL